MILNFSVENYKIFKQRTTLSMMATFDKSHLNNVIWNDNQLKILKTTSIYGANASGKTKFIEALQLMSNFVRGSLAHLPGSQLNYTPFIFDEKSMRKPTSFEVEFVHNSKRYVYGFSYNVKRIVEEHLYLIPGTKKKTIFERNGQEFKFGTEKKIQNENSKRVRENVLFISVGAQFNHVPSIDVVTWFNSELYVLTGSSLEFSINNLVNIIDKDKKFKKLVKKALTIADFGISDIYDKNKGVKREDVISGTPISMIPVVIFTSFTGVFANSIM